MFVACSTLCFARRPLPQALQVIGELGFTKFELAVHEQGPHLRPSEVAADVAHAAALLRIGPGLTPGAFSFAAGEADEAEVLGRFRATCRLARLSTVPLVSVSAGPSGGGMDAEVRRLGKLVHVADQEGILLAAATEVGTLTEDPDAAVELCRRVPGLGLTLDPSHYIAGPHEGAGFDQVYPYVRHVRLRDTGRGPNQFQVRVGQGEVEYGRIVTHLARYNYDRLLTVDIRDVPDAPYAMDAEVRKLKYLLESLV